MRISDWSSDVCSSDLHAVHYRKHIRLQEVPMKALIALSLAAALAAPALAVAAEPATSPEVIKQFPTTLTDAGKQFLDRCSDEQLAARSEGHTSELQSLMRISYAVFCLKKKQPHLTHTSHEI